MCGRQPWPQTSEFPCFISTSSILYFFGMCRTSPVASIGISAFHSTALLLNCFTFSSDASLPGFSCTLQPEPPFNLCHSAPALKVASQPAIVLTIFHPLTNAPMFLIHCIVWNNFGLFSMESICTCKLPWKSWDLWKLGAQTNPIECTDKRQKAKADIMRSRGEKEGRLFFSFNRGLPRVAGISTNQIGYSGRLF